MKRFCIFFVILLLLPALSIAGDKYRVTWSNEKILSYEKAGFPDLSPDGKKMVFLSSNKFLMDEIWIIDSDLKNAKLLKAEGVRYSDPKWSPDGTKIIFIEGLVRIRQINSDGSEAMSISDGKFAKLFPVWWPDGSKIIYFEGSSIDSAAPDNVTGLYLFNLVDNSTGLFGEPGWDGQVSFSPDGSTLVFLEGQELIFLNLDGTVKERRKMRSYTGADPIWSPNGKYIILGNLLYVLESGEEIPFLPDSVFTYREKGKSVLKGPIGLTLSKDGKKLAFMMAETNSFLMTDKRYFRAKIKVLDLKWK